MTKRHPLYEPECDAERKCYDRLIAEFEDQFDVGDDQSTAIAPNGKPFLTFMSSGGYKPEAVNVRGPRSRSRYHALLELMPYLMAYRNSAKPGAKMWWRLRPNIEKESPFYISRCRVLIDGAKVPTLMGEMG